MKQIIARADKIRIGDFILEPDGSALEVQGIQKSEGKVTLLFTRSGIISVQPLTLSAETTIKIMRGGK